MEKILFVVLVLASWTGCFSSKKAEQATTAKKSEQYRVAFYNVENLFDTADDPKKEDNDFLPNGKLNWTVDKYQQKLTNLSKVINALGDEDLPEVIGMCEVENAKVLNDLLQKSKLQNYGIIHQDSPDERGIDVALVYDQTEVKVINYEYIDIGLGNDRTREILHAQVEIDKEDIHLFFNHWPSRYSDKTGEKRQKAAKALRTKIDALFAKDKDANVVIMGDFNDEPTDASVAKVLKAQANYQSPQADQLYNLSYEWMKNGDGTHFYDKWNALDQVIVSGSVLDRKGMVCSANQAQIFKQDWMLFQDNRRNVKRPSRFISGEGKVYGGYSDHCPIYLDFSIN